MKKTPSVIAFLILTVVTLCFCSSKVMADEQTSSEMQTAEIKEIAAELGTVFGFKYRITGFPSNKEVELKKVVIHPPMAIPGEKISTEYSRVLKETTDSKGTVENFTGYKFEQGYELVPGLWQFKIFYEDNMVVEKTFNVYLKK